ncbi:VOC family protein [Sporosarcina sp. ACRSL]|uniref:VOC family protein n=1 Tax=Sporosarcina sp. ACRSL TaxID=2918215 RepID=UPI001EF66500|nr:VOC family protein [Sporosarcina sp. ACRSL]MCG7343495.1 VOC family protein [Sporosarcina sp. ACRSL]
MESFVKCIETIYLPVASPKASAEWYEKHLKLKTAAPVEADATQAQLALGSGQSIFLIQSKDLVNANFAEIGGEEQCSLTLEVTDFHRLYDELQKAGATITAIEDNQECGENFYLYDLDGNKIDIWSGWPAVPESN